MLKFVQIYAALYCLNQLLWFFDGMTRQEVPYGTVEQLVKKDITYFDYIQIDEIDSKAYLHVSGKNSIPSLLLRYVVVSITRHTDFQDKIKELYGDDTDNINIIYSIYKPMFSSMYDLLSIIVVLVGFLYFIRSLMNLRVDIDTDMFDSSTTSSGKFSIKKNIETKFTDVIGLSTVKSDLKEYINYFKEREQYIKNGAKIPRGLIFTGPPGTGKTLLAKALAGEAGITFISASGSDFVEVYVGVGAKRMRQLFEIARKNSPSIIFIDEIDAVGRPRNNVRYGNSEMASTVNQLLTEMDGFAENDNVMVIAATNMVNSLDKALTRTGRFDKKIVFDRPNKQERDDMFELYMNNITLCEDLKTKLKEYTAKLSEMTAGLTGSDICAITNHAIMEHIKNYRKDNKDIDKVSGATFIDFQKSIEEIAIGMEKRERTMTDKEKETVAYHEAGHALINYMLSDCHPPIKISIIPRGESALGYTQPEPNDDKLRSKEYIMADICSYLGGRVAEQIKFGCISTGAYDDIEKLTKMAHGAVALYGMDNVIGPINVISTDELQHSEHYKKMVDERVSDLVNKMQTITTDIISQNMESLENIAKYLLEHEEITKYDFEKIVSPDLSNSINIKDIMNQ
jgi:AFG3 family protein